MLERAAERPCRDSGPQVLPTALTNSARISRGEVVLAVLAVVAIAVVFALAGWMTPDPRGFGTHQQLGLNECVFRNLMGINCPHCGMTTSFCWFVRGEFGHALRANVAGTLAAVMCVVAVPWLVSSVIARRWIGVSSPGRWFAFAFAGWTGLAVVLWMMRWLS